MRLLLCGMAALFALTSQAAEIPLRDFARHPEYGRVSLSPGGDYLALTMPLDDRTILAVLRVADRKLTGVLRFRDEEHVRDFWWVSDHRVVASLEERHGALAMPEPTGELVGMDADGGKSAYLFGHRAPLSVGSHLARATVERASADMVDPLPDDPNYALIAVNQWDALGGGLTRVFKLNVYTGRKIEVAHAPVPGAAKFMADRQGVVRYARVLDLDDHYQTFWREAADAEWQHENVGALASADIEPLKFAADGRAVYLSSTEFNGHACLVRRELDGGARRAPLACDDRTDLVRPIFSFDGRVPVAAVFPSGIRLLETTAPDRALLEAIRNSFPGQAVEPVSASGDGERAVIRVFSDRNPGDFYLFTRGTRKADYLLSARSWIDPEQMAERRPITFKARDGFVLYGYLTLPRGVKTEKLPLVVHPHGGPFSVRDTWEWDADSQMLASRGYAVLQVNFRGSAGYGRAYADAGKRGWDSVMINDITDGTRWAVAQGIADNSRLCIYGGSYGGYAALMSVVKEPDLYRCAVGYVGVYDLNAWRSESDVSGSAIGKHYIDEFIGDGKEDMAAHSPIAYLDHLRAPVLIVAGEQDKRVPFSQAKLLRSALEARKLPYEWLSKSVEGHGFYREDNRVEFYEKLLAFLNKHIGGDTIAGEGQGN